MAGTVYSIQYTVYSIQYTVYSIQYTVYCIQYTVYSIQYTLCTKNYTLYNIHYTIYTIHYTLTSLDDIRESINGVTTLATLIVFLVTVQQLLHAEWGYIRWLPNGHLLLSLLAVVIRSTRFNTFHFVRYSFTVTVEVLLRVALCLPLQ